MNGDVPAALRQKCVWLMPMVAMDPQSRVCPVCWDEDAYDASGAILGVGCNRGHAVCVSCARKLAYVAGPCVCKDKQSCFCTGLVMPCPL